MAMLQPLCSERGTMTSTFVSSALALALACSTCTAFAAPKPPVPFQAYGQDQNRGGWDAPPGDLRDIQRQGFHDGIQAARNDFQNRGRMDPDHHGEFRHPPVPPEARDDYRDGYRRGYSVAMNHMQGGGDRGNYPR